jgi:hypothetical protein
LDLRWSELAKQVQNRTVEIVLPDAATIRGNVTGVTPDSLDIDIRKTSDRRTHPKGRTSITRSSVKTLLFRETKGNWRALGTAIGAGAGGAAGAVIAIRAHNEGNTELAATSVAATVGAGAALGYFVGRSADRRTTIIRIID